MLCRSVLILDPDRNFCFSESPEGFLDPWTSWTYKQQHHNTKVLFTSLLAIPTAAAVQQSAAHTTLDSNDRASLAQQTINNQPAFSTTNIQQRAQLPYIMSPALSTYFASLPPPSMLYALQIKPESLGAHLEAYINTLPTITTLRLCNRFGQGEAAGVTALPTEIIDMIETFILGDARAKQLAEWSSNRSCYENKCARGDHFSLAELDARVHSSEAYREVAHRIASSEDSTERTAFFEVDFEEMTLQYFSDDEWIDRCVAGHEMWEERIKGLHLMSKLLERDFGVQIRVGYGPLGEEKGKYHREGLNVINTTHLMLPVGMGGKAEGVEMKRFGREVKVLGLEVVVQKADLYEEDEDEDADEDEGWEAHVPSEDAEEDHKMKMITAITQDSTIELEKDLAMATSAPPVVLKPATEPQLTRFPLVIQEGYLW